MADKSDKKSSDKNAFTPENFGGWLTKLSWLPKLLFLLGIALILYSRSTGSRTAYVEPPGRERVLCDEYKVNWISKRRMTNQATLEYSINHCIEVELNDEPFKVHFGHVFNWRCVEREDGILVVKLFCPMLTDPVDLAKERSEKEKRELNDWLKTGPCSQSPWQLVGMARCTFQIKQ